MSSAIELSSSALQEPASSSTSLRKKETTFATKSEIFYNAGNENSCLTCFLVMRLDESTTAGEGFVRLLWTYPYSAPAVLLHYPNLGKFAMANAGTSYTVDMLSYTFVLTDSKGIREHGHTTAFVNGEAIVAISPYPWCNFFYRLAYLFRTNGDEGGQHLVKALCKCQTPPSGGMFNTPLNLGMTFRRPYDRLCSFIDTSPLDMLMIFPDITVLFSLLADLLLEKHVIIAGPNFSLVATVVMSLQALIAPFDWMHILIPILPTSLLDVLAAPPPYLVGILTSQLKEIARIPLDSVVLVRLGSDGICQSVQYFNESKDYLPHSGQLSALRIGLNILKLRHPKDQTVRDLCSLFLTYYATLFGEVVLKGAGGYMRTKKLSQSSKIFFEKLLCTQSFNILSEEVKKILASNSMSWMDNEFIVATVRGHPDAFPEHYETLIKEESGGGGFIERYEDCFGSRETFSSFTAAVHGFGGHQLGVSRLLYRCLCSKWCGVDDNFEDEGYYPGSRMGLAILQNRYRSTSSETPVIEDIAMETVPQNLSDEATTREFTVAFSQSSSPMASAPSSTVQFPK